MKIINQQPDIAILVDGYQYFQSNFKTQILTAVCFPWVWYYSRKFQKQYWEFCFTYQRIGTFKGQNGKQLEFNSLDHYYDDLAVKKLTDYRYFHCFTESNIKLVTIFNQKQQAISGLVATKPQQKKWVIALHGWTENKYLALRQAAWFYENGFNILTFDSMAHGLSYGTYTDLGLTAANDLIDIINYLKSQYRITEIGLIGNSMGASCALYYSQITSTQDVNWIIADCGFADLMTQLRYIMQYRYLKPWWLISYGMAKRMKKFINSDIKQMNLIKPPATSQIPILYIHGQQDNFVPIFMSKMMAEAKNSDPKIEHLWIEGINHVEAISQGHGQYVAKIKAFVSKNQSNQ